MRCEEEEENKEMAILYCAIKPELSDSEEACSENEFTRTMMVNGHKAACLYDTGATGVAVKTNLVNPDQYIGKNRTCVFTNGTKQKYPVARIKIKGECFTGETEAIVVDSLVTDLIIGPKLCNWTRQESRTEGTETSGMVRTSRTSDVVSNVNRSVPRMKNNPQVDKQCLAEKDGRDDVIGGCVQNSAANKNGGVLIVESETEKIAGCNTRAHN